MLSDGNLLHASEHPQLRPATLPFSRAAHTLPHRPWNPWGAARATKALLAPQLESTSITPGCRQSLGRERHPGMQAEPWTGTNLPSPVREQLAVVTFQHTPSPCASAALLASEPRDGAKSPPLLSHSLPRGAAGLADGFPMPGTPRVGLAAAGKRGRGQLATLRPRTGVPKSFWQRQRGRHGRFGFSGQGSLISHCQRDSHFFPYFYSSPISAVPLVFQLSLHLGMELLSPLERLSNLRGHFAFFFFLIYSFHSISIWRPQVGWGIVSVGSTCLASQPVGLACFLLFQVWGRAGTSSNTVLLQSQDWC